MLVEIQLNKGLKILCNSLMNSKILMDFHMWHCHISSIETIRYLLKSNTMMKILDLEGNQLTD